MQWCFLAYTDLSMAFCFTSNKYLVPYGLIGEQNLPPVYLKCCMWKLRNCLPSLRSLKQDTNRLWRCKQPSNHIVNSCLEPGISKIMIQCEPKRTYWEWIKKLGVLWYTAMLLARGSPLATVMAAGCSHKPPSRFPWASSYSLLCRQTTENHQHNC